MVSKPPNGSGNGVYSPLSPAITEKKLENKIPSQKILYVYKCDTEEKKFRIAGLRKVGCYST